MKSKDQQLLEEAYEQIQLQESMLGDPINWLGKYIKNFIQSKIKLSSEEQNQLSEIVQALKKGDASPLVQTMKDLGVTAFLKDSLQKLSSQSKTVHEEGVMDKLKQAGRFVREAYLLITNFVYGKTGSTRQLFTLLVLVILFVAGLYFFTHGGLEATTAIATTSADVLVGPTGGICAAIVNKFFTLLGSSPDATETVAKGILMMLPMFVTGGAVELQKKAQKASDKEKTDKKVN